MKAEKIRTPEEIEFYNNPFQFSYSSLSKLLWNPITFYQMYVLNIREEKTDAHLVNGKVIHSLLLENHLFNDNYIVSPSNIPTDKHRVTVDRVFYHHSLLEDDLKRESLVDYKNAILDVMVDIGYWQNLKTDDQRLDKVLTPEAISYFNFLLSKGNKTLIDQTTYDYCLNAVEIIKSNPRIINLLGSEVSQFDNIEVLNEKLFVIPKYKDYNFGIKGIIDNLVINHEQKIIYINDLKTSGKDLKDFKESIEYWNYWLQAAMYHTIVEKVYDVFVQQGYKIEFRFIVIDKNYQCYDFYVSSQTMSEWLGKFEATLEISDWHYTNCEYGLPYHYHHGLVIL